MIKKMTTLLLIFFSFFILVGCDDETSGNGTTIDPDGQTLGEVILYEDILAEHIMDEQKLDEFREAQIKKIEATLDERIIVEDLKIEVFLQDDILGILDNYFITEAYNYDINWPAVIAKYSVGSAVIFVTGVAAGVSSFYSGGSAAFVFVGSFKGALTGAIIGAITGAAINSGMALLDEGKNPEAIKKYAIEGSADQFMWGAITGALLGGISGGVKYAQAAKEGLTISGSSGVNGILKATENGYEVINAWGNKVGDVVEVVGKVGSRNGQILNVVRDVSGKTVGLIDGAGKVVTEFTDDAGQLWSLAKFMNAERTKGVSLAWSQEKALIEATGVGTRQWTPSQINEILTRGKVTGFEGHHINNVAHHPHLANNPDNIRFLTVREHRYDVLLGHGGDTTKKTVGDLISRLFNIG